MGRAFFNDLGAFNLLWQTVPVAFLTLSSRLTVTLTRMGIFPFRPLTAVLCYFAPALTVLALARVRVLGTFISHEINL